MTGALLKALTLIGPDLTSPAGSNKGRQTRPHNYKRAGFVHNILTTECFERNKSTLNHFITSENVEFVYLRDDIIIIFAY